MDVDSVSDGHLWNYMRVMGGTYDNPEPLTRSRFAIHGWYGMFGKNDGVSGIYGKDIFRQRVTFNPTHVLAEGGEHYDADGTYQIQRCFHRTNSSNTWTRSTALTIHAREARTSLSTDLFIRPLETSNYERPIPQEGTISVATGTSQIIGTDTEFTRIFVPVIILLQMLLKMVLNKDYESEKY